MTRSSEQLRAQQPASARRRTAGLLIGVGAAVALLASGCGAGQDAQTARKRTSVPGENITRVVEDGAGNAVGSVSVRNVVVGYGGLAPYAAGSSAPIEGGLYNDLPYPVTVQITSPRTAPAPGTAVARTVKLVQTGGQASVAPTARPTPNATASRRTTEPSATPIATPAATPTASAGPAAGSGATLTIPAGGFVVLGPGGETLRAFGLSGDLRTGQSLALTFTFAGPNNAAVAVIDVVAGVSVPVTAPPRATPVTGEIRGGV